LFPRAKYIFRLASNFASRFRMYLRTAMTAILKAEEVVSSFNVNFHNREGKI